MSSNLVKMLVASALMGYPVYDRTCKFRIGVTSAKQHDPERLKAAQLKRERKAAKRAKARA